MSESFCPEPNAYDNRLHRLVAQKGFLHPAGFVLCLLHAWARERHSLSDRERAAGPDHCTAPHISPTRQNRRREWPPASHRSSAFLVESQDRPPLPPGFERNVAQCQSPRLRRWLPVIPAANPATPAAASKRHPLRAYVRQAASVRGAILPITAVRALQYGST
ncbi:hypothetical protein AAFF_G00055660 [Aldrovandia affinis]|uniref:Uncharacterized protein n=1 Tax=Aldrovandia affinis TaxID=143900 RepID=A0AAD7WEA3_9TELE|nr:hypothetical protein AAFF_G00055660 [Aldrovandia affinis]